MHCIELYTDAQSSSVNNCSRRAAMMSEADSDDVSSTTRDHPRRRLDRPTGHHSNDSASRIQPAICSWSGKQRFLAASCLYSIAKHRCKNVFLRFLIWSHFFTFLIFQTFFILKNVGKVGTCRNFKFNGFINNRILYPVIRM